MLDVMFEFRERLGGKFGRQAGEDVLRFLGRQAL